MEMLLTPLSHYLELTRYSPPEGRGRIILEENYGLTFQVGLMERS